MKLLKLGNRNIPALERTRTALTEKLRESALSVLPIMLIVTLLCLCIAPMQPELLLSFLLGTVMLVVGMGLFSLGAEHSMTEIGNKIGTALTRTRNLPLILGVLADTVPHIDSTVLLAVVGAGVGLFMSVCMLRIMYGVRLRWVLLGSYAVVFLLASLTDPRFLSIAFDSGGVTTGPMTVPFILALGVGVSNVRSDDRAEADSFGLVALCSIGPIIAVMLLGLLVGDSEGAFELVSASYGSTVEIGRGFISALPVYIRETAVAMLPIIAIFLIFQLLVFRMSRRRFLSVLFGIAYTYVGLVLFLTGVNVGFSALGAALGAAMTEGWLRYLLIPLSALLGWFIISAEPAVAVLEHQIEEVSAGAISGKVIKRSLSFAIALAMALSMLRVMTGISLLWFTVPGYAASLLLSFFVPDIYTAIAFDSGGVASGPMTATFMLRFMMGASLALGGDVLSDAFGIVALVAMMPLLSIQLVGFYYGRIAPKRQPETESYGDYDIIELWEESA